MIASTLFFSSALNNLPKNSVMYFFLSSDDISEFAAARTFVAAYLATGNVTLHCEMLVEF